MQLSKVGSHSRYGDNRQSTGGCGDRSWVSSHLSVWTSSDTPSHCHGHSKGPLERAVLHIREHGLSTYITTRLSDGIEKLLPQEADTLVIAGMGGGLVRKILGQNPEVLATLQEAYLTASVWDWSGEAVSWEAGIWYRSGEYDFGGWQILSDDAGSEI